MIRRYILLVLLLIAGVSHAERTLLAGFTTVRNVGAPQYSVEELTALVEEAHSRGLKVASHAHGREGIVNALLAGVDTIEHASFIDDEGIRLLETPSFVMKEGVVYRQPDSRRR